MVRLGVVRGDGRLEDRALPLARPVVVGPDGDLAIPGLPREHVLFTRTPGGVVLHLAEGMKGRVVIEGRPEEVSGPRELRFTFLFEQQRREADPTWVSLASQNGARGNATRRSGTARRPTGEHGGQPVAALARRTTRRPSRDSCHASRRGYLAREGISSRCASAAAAQRASKSSRLASSVLRCRGLFLRTGSSASRSAGRTSAMARSARA